jgi:hypothetical protein
MAHQSSWVFIGIGSSKGNAVYECARCPVRKEFPYGRNPPPETHDD